MPVVYYTLGADYDPLNRTQAYTSGPIASDLSHFVDTFSGYYQAAVYGGGPGSQVLWQSSAQNASLYTSSGGYLFDFSDSTAWQRIVGGNFADTILGGTKGDDIDGGAGADTMNGGAGDDRYSVDDIDDRVVEKAGGGDNDVVVTSVDYVMPKNVETLSARAGDITLVGNSLANRLEGSEFGGNVLIGGAGSDTYTVYHINTLIVDTSGVDTVISSIDYTLGAGLENLNISYRNKVSPVLTGNDGANIITGGYMADTLNGAGGADTLDGGEGDDTLSGGAGDDTFIVAEAGDTVIENANEGLDTVEASISYTLSTNVENLILKGASADGTGNGFANTITGTSGANTLRGLDGDDTLNGGGGADRLNGGLGSDTLTGGTNADTFYFNTALGATNVDTITDFNATADTMYIAKSVFKALTETGELFKGAFKANDTGLASDSTDRIVYETDTGKLFYDADGNKAGGVAGIHFATLANMVTITSADFVVI